MTKKEKAKAYDEAIKEQRNGTIYQIQIKCPIVETELSKKYFPKYS